MFRLIYSFVFVLFNLFYSTHSERLHEQIYSTIEGSAACFRRLNGTHQAGCASSEKGSVGVVEMILSADDAHWIVDKGTASPYVAVVNTVLFNDVIEIFISNSNKITGVLIYDDPNARSAPLQVFTKSLKPPRFSEESRCPNEYYSAPGSQCSSDSAGGTVWNEGGASLLRKDIPFPIFYLPQSRLVEIEKIKMCYSKYNLDKDNQDGKPLCSLQLTSFMFAAVNSETCLRRATSSALFTDVKFCDPLGDKNVYSTLFPLNNQATSDYLLVTARIDSASLFEGISPGAASSVVGIVTLIATAVTLSKMIPIDDANLYNTNIVWTLLNGEAFDYIGSQRLAYDLSNGAWPPHAPLALPQIKLHLEIGQLGGSLTNHTPTWNITLFAPYTTVPPTEVLDLMSEFFANLNNTEITAEPQFGPNLPPSSLHSFRRILRNETESGKLVEVLIVDHNNTFSNKFYHSVLDVAAYVGFSYKNISVGSDGTFVRTDDLLANGTMKETDMQVKIARLSTSLAMTLYQRVTNKKYEGDIAGSAHLVDEVLECLLSSQSCRLLGAAETGGGAGAAGDAGPAPLYVGVPVWPGPATLLEHMLVLLTGRPVSEVTAKGCLQRSSQNYSYYWLNGWNHTGVCYQTTVNYTQAISPAFTIPGYDMSSGEFSTWTESVWNSMSARVFVKASGVGARTAGVAGAVLTLLTAIVLYWLKKHAHVLFEQPQGDVSQPSRTATAGILRSVNC